MRKSKILSWTVGRTYSVLKEDLMLSFLIHQNSLLKILTMIKVIDLFSGCGGLSLGLEQAGFKILAAFDKWKPAIEVYENNFKHPIFDIDLSTESAVKQIKKWKPKTLSK